MHIDDLNRKLKVGVSLGHADSATLRAHGADKNPCFRHTWISWKLRIRQRKESNGADADGTNDLCACGLQ
jgi:hypothetical protein